MVNIRCLGAHLDELQFHLSQHSPHVVLLQETWLDKSTEEVRIHNYMTVSRKDRSDDPNRGGVLTLARKDFNKLVFVEHSKAAERSWHFLHLDTDILLLGNWYRSPSSTDDGFEDLHEELSKLMPEVTGTILTGDFNIHHAPWLRFSNGKSTVGANLKAVFDTVGLQQLVREPTRNEYLLDLFATDVAGSKAEVGNYIADHKFILGRVPAPVVGSLEVTKSCFKLGQANWKELGRELDTADWAPLDKGTAEDAFAYFLDVLWSLLCTYIPYKQVSFRKSSHPWLNDRCEAAIRAKNLAEGTDRFDQKRAVCSKVLKEEQQKHVTKLKEKLSSLPKGSKQWWKLNRELLQNKTKCSSIPPLRNDKTWENSPNGKANLFAKTFAAKSTLPGDVADCLFFAPPDLEMDQFVALRSRYAMKLFKKLNESKATGPDRIPAAILKRLAEYLAVPFTRVCRRLLQEACWPSPWKLHHICPLYKKGSAFQAGNYRGVHLTAVLSKIAEKLIGQKLLHFLHSGKFGEYQWAFTPGLSARDLVTALFLSWILAACTGKKVGGYLGDISGAFDRVCKEYLLGKLCSAGVGPLYLNFLDAYLQPRRAQVVVEGTTSDEFEISNTVFQGTVLGPPLWNLFFQDVTEPASSFGGTPSVFADDLSAFKQFDKNIENAEILRELHVCRTRVHKWGRQNRVAFDASKEHLVVLHPVHGEGDHFKLLGTLVDCKLLMSPAIEQILAQIRPKIRAIVRMQSHYPVAELIHQFKTHVWGSQEYHNGAIFHASSYLIDRLDGVHRQFLRDINLTEEVAFLSYNFAPPTLRRNIGMLGFLHKRVLGKAHPCFQKLLPFHADVFDWPGEGTHDKVLYNHFKEIQFQHAMYARSIFGMVYVYNHLPQRIIDCPSISLFQRLLTKAVRKACEQHDLAWKDIFSCRVNLVHTVNISFDGV